MESVNAILLKDAVIFFLGQFSEVSSDINHVFFFCLFLPVKQIGGEMQQTIIEDKGPIFLVNEPMEM